MLFYVRYLDKEYRVRVESQDQKLFVSLGDEEPLPVDLVFQGNDFNFIQENKIFAANVIGNKNDYTVWHPSGNMPFTVESEYRRLVGLLKGQDLHQENHVYSKMPGKIAKIIAKQGAKVTKGDPVLIMEAMKMENEIRAPLSGEITKICVSEGQAVETGCLLIELTPLEN